MQAASGKRRPFYDPLPDKRTFHVSSLEITRVRSRGAETCVPASA